MCVSSWVLGRVAEDCRSACADLLTKLDKLMARTDLSRDSQASAGRATPPSEAINQHQVRRVVSVTGRRSLQKCAGKQVCESSAHLHLLVDGVHSRDIGLLSHS